jgi:heptosyltransferase III
MNETAVKEPHRFLLCRTDHLGDLILSLPCASLIKAVYPEARISFLVQAYTAPVVNMLEPVDDVIEIGPEANADQILEMILLGKFDTAVVLYPSFQVARALYQAKIPRRAGISYRWYSFLFNCWHSEHRKTNLKHEAEYNLSLTYSALKRVGNWEDHLGKDQLFPLALRIPDEALGTIEICLKKLTTEAKKIVIIHPGGGGSAHRWSLYSYCELARLLCRYADILIIVSGGKGEEQLCCKVAEAAGDKGISVAGELDLIELSALLKNASLVVANSTGPLHLARALGIPVLGLYPSTPAMTPKRWGPYGLPGNVLMPPPEEAMDALAVDSVYLKTLELLGMTP